MKSRARSLVVAVVLAHVLAAVLVPAESTGVRRAPRPPNILIILTDDQRLPETMEVMPKTRQWFADGGTTFTNAFATTPLCCPSRASIFTGRYAHNHGVLQNGQRGELNQHFTIQRYLDDADYVTGLVGKLLNNWNNCKRPPGWDFWTSVFGNYFDFTVGTPGSCVAQTGYSTTFLKDRALQFLREETPRVRPWFLHLSVIAPHNRGPAGAPQAEPKYENAPIPPFQPGPSYLEADRSDKPPWVQLNPIWTQQRVAAERTGTLRALLSVDDMVDEIFNELEQSGEADNTLAFFLSDNGFMWGEHAQVLKSKSYAESARIPLFMRWPDAVPAGGVDTRLVGNIDLVPTIMQATGIRPPGPTIDGRSLLDSTWQRDRLLLEFWSALVTPPQVREPDFASTVTATSQYTEYYEQDAQTPKQWPAGDPLGTGPVREYYDLASDPSQLTNRLHDGIGANDPDVDQLSSQLAQDRRCSGHGQPNSERPPCP